MKLMDIFSNVKKLIDPIEYHSYIYLPKNFDKRMETSALLTASGFFDFPHREFRNGWNNSIYFRELIKNARVHGGNIEGRDCYCGLFMNMDKFCFGINDGGDYFKRKDIRDIWENRRKLKEFHKSDDQSVGFHIGYGVIRDWEGKIFVDSEFGTIYLSKDFVKKSILKNYNNSERD